MRAGEVKRHLRVDQVLRRGLVWPRESLPKCARQFPHRVEGDRPEAFGHQNAQRSVCRGRNTINARASQYHHLFQAFHRRRDPVYRARVLQGRHLDQSHQAAKACRQLL